jgi:hypothetical protein
MRDAFRHLCAEIDSATKTATTPEERRPEYQKVLDYIRAHPEERDDIAAILARHVKQGY